MPNKVTAEIAADAIAIEMEPLKGEFNDEKKETGEEEKEAKIEVKSVPFTRLYRFADWIDG